MKPKKTTPKGKYFVCAYIDFDMWGEITCLKPGRIRTCEKCKIGKWDKIDKKEGNR